MTVQIAMAGAIMAWMSAGMEQSESTTTGAENVYGELETYNQRLVIESGADPSELPTPRLAAVYDGRTWALSTRWDDSNPNALNIRRKMLANGIRGTFYLNSRSPEEPRESLAYRLTGQGECSVGGHSVSHPHLLPIWRPR